MPYIGKRACHCSTMEGMSCTLLGHARPHNGTERISSTTDCHTIGSWRLARSKSHPSAAYPRLRGRSTWRRSARRVKARDTRASRSAGQVSHQHKLWRTGGQGVHSHPVTDSWIHSLRLPHHQFGCLSKPLPDTRTKSTTSVPGKGSSHASLVTLPVRLPRESVGMNPRPAD